MEENNTQAAATKKKVLIVDDEPAVSTVFETALRNAGFDVKVVDNGAKGLETVAAEPFDLVLLDEMMPDMQGNDVLKAIKADQKTANLKVAMLTNFAQDEMVKEAFDRGAVEYILKYQISTDDLVKKVNSMFAESVEIPEP